MFFLHTSNRTEQLAEQLATVLAAGGPPSLFGGETFLVQSRGMERLLSHFLADCFGVWCSGVYLLPAQFVDELCARFGVVADSGPFERDVLVWRLERLLRNGDVPEMGPLHGYLAGERSELKRYQLAYRLANVFDQYQIMRPDMLSAWQRGDLVCSDGSEAWQAWLWRALRQENPTALHRGEVVGSLQQTLLSADGSRCRELCRIFVFGIHTLPPLFLGMLEALARRIDVHFFLLSPCRLYWGDIESARSRVLSSAHRAEADHAIAPAAGLYHPLLAGLGRQGAHFQELLLDMAEGYVDDGDAFVDPLAHGASLLLRLQADLLDGREAPDPEDGPVVIGDDSLTIVSCHSRFREIMVLKDYLLSRLYQEPSLQLHEIVVMAPDIEQYAPFIPASFNDIAHDISDCRIRRENRLLDGFLQFLHLFGGRYGWSEVLGLLERPEIHPRFGLSAGDLDLVRHWVLESGIRWGLSSEQRREDGLYPFPSAAWQTGLERMLMGLAVDSDQPVSGILPYTDIEGGQGEALGGLCRFVELLDQARRAFRSDATLVSWARRFRDWCGELFVDDGQPELLELLRLVDALEERYGRYHDQPVTGEVVRAWLETVAESRSPVGFLNGRLTFCSLLPMRSVPFKVVCLLGLNDGEYPRNDHFVSFDLLGKRYRKGDRSRRADDRYQFLEAILAARHRLYLSYVGQSIRTNKTIPPSVVVTELLETLHQWYGVTDPVRRQPLQPYSGQYFDGRSDLFSYDEQQCRVAEALTLRAPAGTSSGWLERPLTIEEPQRLSLSELVEFIKGPQRFLVRDVLGIRLDTVEAVAEEHEPFEVAGLDRYQADQLIVTGLLGGQAAEALLRSLQDRLAWPLGEPGRLAFVRRLAEIGEFVGQLEALGGAAPLPPVPFELAIDRISLVGQLTNRYQGGLLFYRYARLRGQDILRAWLFHLVAGQVLPHPVATRIVSADGSFTIGAEQGGAERLGYLLRLYRQGRRFPSELLVEPGLAYARQVVSNRGRGRKPPIEAARDFFRNEMEQGFRPEYRFLYRDLAVDRILDQSFATCCEELLVPLWQMILADSGEGADD